MGDEPAERVPELVSDRLEAEGHPPGAEGGRREAEGHPPGAAGDRREAEGHPPSVASDPLQARSGHAVRSPEAEAVATPLSRSPYLLRLPQSAVALSGLYGRGALRRAIGDGTWRFQWRCLTEPFTGVELRLRLGDTEVLVALDSLATFGMAATEIESDIPSRLHVAYLNGLGAVLWQELETITQRPVRVLEVRLAARCEVTPECLGFELGRDPARATSRGFLRLVDPDPSRNADLERVLLESSRREMPEAAAPTDLRVRWAAVVGHTRLAVAEVEELEEHDIVLLDDAKPTANVLNCWLCAGPTRRYAGRVQWRSGGQLQLVQFDRTGEVNVSADTGSPAKQETGFEDIPVNLRFELAQWNASLAEIGNLAPGTVLDIGQRVEDHAVSVWVEQRCIGKGQLVAIGERLGVRLLSVFAREHT